MKLIGPDSLQSWLVAAACSYVYLVQYGINRLSGMIFVASIDRYHVGREAASLPFNINSAALGLSTPIIGFIAQKLGMRLVIICGSVLSTVGIGTCYFAEDIAALSFLWGILYGIGMACCVCMIPVLITQHFDGKRTSASGIALTGTCLGSFILPPLAQIMLDKYGLSNTFLILSVFALSCAPVALTLRKPFINDQPTDSEKQSLIFHQPTFYDDLKCRDLKGKAGKETKDLEEKHKEGKLFSEGNPAASGTGFGYGTRKEPNHPILSDAVAPKSYERTFNSCENKNGKDRSDFQIVILTEKCQRKLSSDDENLCSSQKQNQTEVDFAGQEGFRTLEDSGNDSKALYANQIKYGTCPNHSLLPNANSRRSSKLVEDHTLKPTISQRMSIFCDPSFLMVFITLSMNSFIIHTFFNIIIDFSLDVGVELINQKYVLMTVSIGELIGRLCLGWVTDHKFLTASTFMAISFIAQGVGYVGIGVSNNFTMLLVILLLFGIAQSGVVIVIPSLIGEFIVEDKQILVITIGGFLSGPLSLTVPLLIEVFREGLGSYKYMFFGMSFISCMCGIWWFFARCISKKEKIVS